MPTYIYWSPFAPTALAVALRSLRARGLRGDLEPGPHVLVRADRVVEAQAQGGALVPQGGVARRLRDLESRAARPHLPVVALTANAQASDVESCLACGMDDYLSKPILKPKLVAVLARYLAPAP